MSKFHQVAYNRISPLIGEYNRNGIVSLYASISISDLLNQYRNLFVNYTLASRFLDQLGFVSDYTTARLAGIVPQIRAHRESTLFLRDHRCDINQIIYEREILPYIVNNTYANFRDTVHNRYASIVAAGVMMIHLRITGNNNFQ
ncbi:hypothetical protein L7G72_12530 [Xenorhabdus bovienii]|uniref:hypothetical protein n=1 Tax=Xenorhabdus bovienii TaxID=40576 RepID=UPI001EDF2FF1|nr:hypothetical protein [Xenorhabdus bovienii]MCG3462665.1 hypothetical protein [Xenorhabdus bovienii]